MRNSSHGFTLIEVLVALIILAIALFAIFKTTQDSIKDTIAVRNRLGSQWVALNVVSSLQVGLLKPPTATTPLSGKTRLVGNNWQWQADLINSNKWFATVRVIVRMANKQRIWERLIVSVKK